MKQNLFRDYASIETNPNWEQHIKREQPLYERQNDIRSPYERDYTRILHSLAYRRLKHKTQVFFNINNDHICTRMEHVQHVESVSCTIAKFLGLNTDLTRAIAMGHDLGHSPFGHEGEVELTKIRTEYGLDRFWHERNSLRIIDDIELLGDDKNNYKNLNLTYAVRDGIISHCGEVDENGIFPRKEAIDLSDFKKAGQFQAYTWEGCVVKIADKIAYLGRDIEDALRMDFITKNDIRDLIKIAKKYNEKTINTTVIIHNFITSVCEHSSPEKGIRLSDTYNAMLDEVKKFNYKAIYQNERFDTYRNYVKLIIRSIFNVLVGAYQKENTPKELYRMIEQYPKLIKDFLQYLNQYSTINMVKQIKSPYMYENVKIYGDLETEIIYVQAIIDFISGMTDKYAISVFEELLTY